MQRRHFPLFAAEGTAGGGGADGGNAGADQGGGGSGTPWHQGLDAELIGHAQNKQWDISDPAKVAAEALKAHRSLEKHFGVPESQLLKLPKDSGDEAAWNGVYQRLGVPADAKDYDFSGVKFNGEDLEAAFVDKIKPALAAARVPKDRADAVVKAFVGYLEDADKAESAETTAKLAEEKSALAKNWGTNPESLKDHKNMLHAKLGAERLGVKAEDIAALEKTVGYSRVMEMFRKIGAGTSEDTFVESKGAGGSPMTQAGAVARKAELMNDKAFVERYLKGDVQAKREMFALDSMIAGVAADAA
jgi:hypothetical protein